MKQYSQIMFASINHELRTPINAILNSLSCMSDKICPTVAQYLEICESSSQFLLSLVNDTLDFAQLQAGKFKMNFQQVEIRKLVADVASWINVQLRLKENIFLIQSVADDVPQQIESDCQRLKSIIINLMRNSTKFTFKGYIQISLRKAKLAFLSNEQVVSVTEAVQIECYDTGIGINKNNQANLFQMFGKVRQQNEAINQEGIGLGLYITKKLVDQMGGTIAVDSRENEYTKFTVTLPTRRGLKISTGLWKAIKSANPEGNAPEPKAQ